MIWKPLNVHICMEFLKNRDEFLQIRLYKLSWCVIIHWNKNWGWVSITKHTYAKANILDSIYFNDQKQTYFITYLDENNLNGWAVCQSPTGNFKRLSISKMDEFSINYICNTNERGFVLKLS